LIFAPTDFRLQDISSSEKVGLFGRFFGSRIVFLNNFSSAINAHLPYNLCQLLHMFLVCWCVCEQCWHRAGQD